MVEKKTKDTHTLYKHAHTECIHMDTNSARDLTKPLNLSRW